MRKLARRQRCKLLLFAIAGGFLFGSTSSLSAARAPQNKPAVTVNLLDTGKTVALRVGQQLIVQLPLSTYDDDYWYVSHNSGDVLKLIAGPDARRPKGWTPMMKSVQVFYFKKQFPGTADLVLEQSYSSVKPMILKVVDQ